jgi:hypothetical protein
MSQHTIEGLDVAATPGKFSVQISTRTPDTVTAVSIGFTESFQKHSKIIPELDHGHFLPYHLEFVIHPTIRGRGQEWWS